MDELSAKRAAEAAAECFDLEFSVETGKRGDRFRNVRPRLQKLVNAEDGLVVNNNAAAVLLVVSALAQGGEVLVSRGELVEIGGSFRIPNIIKAGGASLKLVGAANVTTIDDWRKAISKKTTLILKVHQSNFRQKGEVQSTETKELVALSKEFGVPLAEDLGSGTLLDLTQWGLPKEPTVPEVVAEGVDIVTFSGDKLLGGPQCGLIVGKKRYTDIIGKNALLRTIRVGKVIDSLLCECLDRYLEGKSHDIPFVQMASASLDELRQRASFIIEKTKTQNLQLIQSESRAQVGAGACPEYTIDSWAINVSAKAKSLEALKMGLLAQKTPLATRIEKEKLLIDIRSLLPQDDAEVIEALQTLDSSLA